MLRIAGGQSFSANNGKTMIEEINMTLVNDKYDLIEGTLVHMSTGKGRNADLANKVLDIKLPADAKHTTIANRIAATYARLKTDRRLAKQAGQEVRHAPESFGLYFMQQLMNNICWSAQRISRGVTDGEEFAEKVWGCDFSQDALEDFAMDKVDVENLAVLVDDAFFLLQNVRATFEMDMHTYITEIEPLHVFQEIQQNPETQDWEQVAVAETYNEALPIMEAAIERLREEEENATATVATDTNFG